MKDKAQVPLPLYHLFAKAAAYSSTHAPGEWATSDYDASKNPNPDPLSRLDPFINLQLAIGGAGSGAPMHFHNTAFNALLFGSKYWIVYPPAYNIMSNVQIREWNEKRRVGGLDVIEPATCVQHAGDVVIVPELWGHGVINLDDTVATAIEVRASLFRNKLPRAWRHLSRGKGSSDVDNIERARADLDQRDRDRDEASSNRDKSNAAPVRRIPRKPPAWKIPPHRPRHVPRRRQD